MNFETLVGITNKMKAHYPESKQWQKSEFLWIQTLPPARKGSIGRTIAAFTFIANGLTATFYKGNVLVNGNRISVKLAMMWEKKIIKFQNIRDGEFDYLFCLALYPTEAYGWLIPKKEVWTDGEVRDDRKGITKQHKGADAWIHVDPKNAPKWIQKYGGTLAQFAKVAKKDL